MLRGRRATGWALVVVQGVLLAALVALPSRDHWSVPGWLGLFGWLCVGGGVALVAVAAGLLGPALTPTPVPREGAALVTRGLYSWVRHPIYTGVLLAAFGLVVRSGSAWTLFVGAVTYVFFHAKSSAEERWLSEAHDGYADYAAAVGRFFPRLSQLRPST